MTFGIPLDWLAVAAGLAMMGAGVAYQLHKSRKLEGYAKSHGYALANSWAGTSITGACNGRPFTVLLRSGKNGRTAVSATAAQRAFILDISLETVLSAAGKLVGMQDIRTGDEAFDKAFAVASSDAQLALRVLDPDTRRMLLGLKAGFSGIIDSMPSVSVGPGMVSVEILRAVQDPEKLDALISCATTLAMKVDAA